MNDDENPVCLYGVHGSFCRLRGVRRPSRPGEPRQTTEMAVRAIRASVPFYLCSVFLILVGAFFVGIGQSLYGTIVQILRSIVFRISTAWLFFLWFAPQYIWWFQSLAALLGSLVALAFLALVLRRLRGSLRPKSNGTGV